jgi:RNA polymerase sigma factor (sigma-70 family)
VTPRRLIEPARLAGTAVLRTQSDDRLIDLVREGNDRAFEAIVHRYRAPLLRYCRRFLSPVRAEDAVQQTFVNAIAAIRDGDAEINLRPWLYRIAHNASLNVLRQGGADYDEISEQIDGVETPPQAFERGERFRSVVTAVRDLPERQRDALVLQALEGRSYEEIAVELGVTGGAVRQLLNRARTTLREGVTAFTPPALLARLGGAMEAPVTERVAQVVAGAGGGAVLAKAAALVVVAGAVVGGAVDGGVPREASEAASQDTHAALTATPAQAPAAPASVAAQPIALKSPAGPGHSGSGGSGHRGRKGHRAPVAATPVADHRGGRSHGGSGDGGGSGDDDSHRGGDDHSGSGGGDTSSDDHSGSGSDSSGPGSGGSGDAPTVLDATEDSSGSDGSGSGSSGSGSDDPVEGLKDDSGDGGTSGGRH